MYQRKQDDAMKVHEDDEIQLKQLTDQHNELKLDFLYSKTMIQGVKVFVETQQTKLANVQKTRGTKTFVSTGSQTTTTAN